MRISDWSSDVCSSDLHFKAECRLDRSHMRHDLIHSIREKCAHQEVLYGRLKQAGRARGLKLLPCAIVESSQFRLRLVVEGQRGRAFQLDFFAPIVFHNPRLEAQTLRASPIGSASCRDIGCQYGSITVVAVTL